MEERYRARGARSWTIRFLSFYAGGTHPALHSFPTRRSSDLAELVRNRAFHLVDDRMHHEINRAQDRKSTRLNSSHASISYAAFCLKKKRKWTRNLPASPWTKSRRP